MTLHLRSSDAASEVGRDIGYTDARIDIVSASSGIYRASAKRVLDIFLVLLGAPIVVPVVAFLAALVALDGHNPFYTQLRVGRNGAYFRIWKLRSMVPDADAQLEAHLARSPAARAEWDATQKLKHDPRITRMGRLLRKTSLDELPQLWNVFNGTMSLVGPRPMMIDQERYYYGRSYYALRPGITGFWQISDRNECNFVDRVKFDDSYNRQLSFLTDLKILMRTVVVVLRGTGY